jgi:pimeloyl-ACP methyl ester carboxylesterase
MGLVTCNDVLINYRCVGKGRNVVLIHGLAANHGFWHIDVLLSLARNYRVTVYDLRGHGYSEMPASGYSSKDMTDDLHDLFMHLNIDRAHLIGHSFGGVVALHFAAIHPDRVESLTIVDSRLRLLQPTNRAKDWPNWKEAKHRLTKLGLSIPDDEPESGFWLLNELASPQWRKERYKLEGSPLFIPFSRLGGGNRSAERWLELVDTTTARQDFISPDGLTIESLSTIQHPTLAICGENSPVMPSIQGFKQYLSNCRILTVPGAGHFFPMTHSKLFISQVSDFLAQVDVGDRRRFKRFPLELPIDIRGTPEISYPGSTLDVSQNGILLSCDKKLKVGTVVKLAGFPKSEESQALPRGKVVRIVSNKDNGKYQLGVELFTKDEIYLFWENCLRHKNIWGISTSHNF